MAKKLTFLTIVLLGTFYEVYADNSVPYTLEQENVPPHFVDSEAQSYNFRFKTSDGTERNEHGYFRPGPYGTIVGGSYTYIRPDGKTERVSYIADKFGYKVLPKPGLPNHLDIIIDYDVRIDDSTKNGISTDTLASLIGIGLVCYMPPYFDNSGGTTYNFRFKTSNGIERSENGLSGSDSDGNVVSGFYSYIRPDGKKEIVWYVADKLGFRVRPKPKGPPPENISTAALAALVG